ncbi:MAG TPA: hypothetical protein IAB44_07880 [Candidatus Limivivens intestinipullorum]|uniref:Uncharacterized protein n=1 Tax=Candidatus Limivivens intestinipullorum TaxID=2840858 RepID=A0A9D1ESV4_9FIRM|nr:hypothetical protein [Candidatus Limivivens intestinipullorum]
MERTEWLGKAESLRENGIAVNGSKWRVLPLPYDFRKEVRYRNENCIRESQKNLSEPKQKGERRRGRRG